MTINLLQSQAALMDSVNSQQARRPIRSSLIVAATGLGKTVIAGGLARTWPKGRVMMMSHRYELNQQAIKQLSKICGEMIGLEQASSHADIRGVYPDRVVVASVQTLNSYQRKHKRYRFEKFAPEDFGLLIIDEAHHAVSEGYMRVIEHFRQNPELCVVGVTATPDRLDGVGMGRVFESVACDLNLSWAIENGWLVAPKQMFVKVDGLDLTQVRTVGGDFDPKQLARLVQVEENLHAMAKPIVDVCGEDKQAVVFTASVAQAHRMSELIRDYHTRAFGECGLDRAVAVDGNRSPQDPHRRGVFEKFMSGRTQYLCNCSVATEGFDAPNVRVVAIGRPTKSRSLYLQMLGRGTRPLPGTVDGLASPEDRIAAIRASDKPYVTVMDFVGQAGRHKLVCSTDFMVDSCKVESESEYETREVLERANSLTSRKEFDGSSLDAIQQAREQLAAERESKRKRVTVGVDYKLVEQETLYDLSMVPYKVPNYMQRYVMSDKQRTMMLKLGYTGAQIDQIKNKVSASKAITHAIENPITGFGKWLKSQKEKEARQNAEKEVQELGSTF